jgi:hypothetical protein
VYGEKSGYSQKRQVHFKFFKGNILTILKSAGSPRRDK